jgi:hypothetical protein
MYYIFSAGYPCPMNFNPADFYIKTMAVVPGKEAQCQQRIQVRLLFLDNKNGLVKSGKHVRLGVVGKISLNDCNSIFLLPVAIQRNLNKIVKSSILGNIALDIYSYMYVSMKPYSLLGVEVFTFSRVIIYLIEISLFDKSYARAIIFIISNFKSGSSGAMDMKIDHFENVDKFIVGM